MGQHIPICMHCDEYLGKVAAGGEPGLVSVRKFEDGDKPLLEESVRLDPHHQGIKPETFAAEPNTETQVWAVDGKPVFFLRCSRALRLDVQFVQDAPKDHVKKALNAAFPVVSAQAKKSGYREMVFDSVYEPLIAFCRKYLGFSSSPDFRRFL